MPGGRFCLRFPEVNVACLGPQRASEDPSRPVWREGTKRPERRRRAGGTHSAEAGESLEDFVPLGGTGSGHRFRGRRFRGRERDSRPCLCIWEDVNFSCLLVYPYRLAKSATSAGAQKESVRAALVPGAMLSQLHGEAGPCRPGP